MNYLDLMPDSDLTVEKYTETYCPSKVDVDAPNHCFKGLCLVWKTYGMHFEDVLDPAKKDVCLKCWKGETELPLRKDDVP